MEDIQRKFTCILASPPRKKSDLSGKSSSTSGAGIAAQVKNEQGYEFSLGEVIREEVVPAASTTTSCASSAGSLASMEEEILNQQNDKPETGFVAPRMPDGTLLLPEIDVDQLNQSEQKWEAKRHTSTRPGATSHCLRSLYGKPASSKEVAAIIGPLPQATKNVSASSTASPSRTSTPVDKRLEHHARLIPDEREVQDRLIRRGVIDTKRDFVNPDDSNKAGVKREIKPRRGPLPAVFVSDFMKSIVMIHSPNPQNKGAMKPRWVFSGVLNGWPGLHTLELISITCRTADKISNLLENDKTNLLRKQMLRYRLVRLWHTDNEGAQNIPPHIHSSVLQGSTEVRVTLRAPAYSSVGYQKGNPGYLFWFEACRTEGGHSKSNKIQEPTVGLRMLFGKRMIETMERESSLGIGDGLSKCTNVHYISHRYATGEKREQVRDKLTYHTVILLEWDHERYVTIVELALLYGLGGYAGKSNWYEDKLDPLPKLYEAFDPCMIVPWQTQFSETRCFDLPHSKNFAEFKNYMNKYTGPNLRFLDPQYTYSNPCRLTFRTKQHIAQYLYNYVRRNPTYSELNRNCQTFTADFYGFMAGKKDVLPYHPLNRVDYQNRAHTFLYDPDLF